MRCENWIAQLYLKDYHETLSRLPKLKAEAEWFKSKGFTFEQDS